MRHTPWTDRLSDLVLESTGREPMYFAVADEAMPCHPMGGSFANHREVEILETILEEQERFVVTAYCSEGVILRVVTNEDVARAARLSAARSRFG